MKPSELSQELKRIASAIENSKNPSRELVAKDLKAVISKIAIEEAPQKEETKEEMIEKMIPKMQSQGRVPKSEVGVETAKAMLDVMDLALLKKFYKGMMESDKYRK